MASSSAGFGHCLYIAGLAADLRERYLRWGSESGLGCLFGPFRVFFPS